MTANPFVGRWTYRSLLNDPDINEEFDRLEFGRATIDIKEAGPIGLAGTLGGPDFSLSLHGSFGFGFPMQVRFQGKGLVNGEQWIYDYLGWLVTPWPNSDSTLQRSAIVGSVVRTIPHSGSGGVVHPAGVVASFYAVRVD